ncbi:hypothetical protein Slin14017_G085410 [Septoria linicola]|nr:hypothetical protein Slin14017_G085410 [Septoria linicola]
MVGMYTFCCDLSERPWDIYQIRRNKAVWGKTPSGTTGPGT